MICDLLNDELVQTDVDAVTWRDAVYSVGKLLKQQGKIEDSFIDSMLSTVEKLGPYMILLPGVAFFHGAPQSGVHETCLSFVTFKEDVVFTDFENQHIQCAFGFGAVDAGSHMQMMVKMAALFQDEEFLELARNHGSKQKLMKKFSQY